MSDLFTAGFAAGLGLGGGAWVVAILFRFGRGTISAFGVGRGWPD